MFACLKRPKIGREWHFLKCSFVPKDDFSSCKEPIATASSAQRNCSSSGRVASKYEIRISRWTYMQIGRKGIQTTDKQTDREKDNTLQTNIELKIEVPCDKETHI